MQLQMNSVCLRPNWKCGDRNSRCQAVAGFFSGRGKMSPKSRSSDRSSDGTAARHAAHSSPELAELAVVALLLAIPVATLLLLPLLVLHSNTTRAIALVGTVAALLNADHKNGGRRIRRFRNLAIWKTGARYFPMTMHKSVDLPPEKGPYLFGYHPHGVLGLGHFFGFACNALGIEEHFPGVFVHGTTLETNFNVPFLRDLILATGMIGAGKQSLNHVLSKKKESVVLVVGGAAEAMDAVPGTNRLTLNKRFGFIKIAIKNGASLVPVFAFGENDIWDQVPNPPGSFVRNFQSLVKKLTGASPVLFYGRFGIIPYRRPVNVVVGMPLAVVKNEEPSDEEVAQVHALYVERLTMLYHAHKDTYLASRTAELIIC